MTRLWLCVLVLSGTTAFLSCGATNQDNADGGPGPAGTGGGGRAGAGGSSALVPCDGLGYFVQQGWCASTFEAQVAKDTKDVCDRVNVSIASCSDGHRWSTEQRSLPTDPISCTYDAAGSLVAAQTCTDHPVASWSCDGGGGTSYPGCLIAGDASNLQACTSTNACNATGGAGGSGGGGG